MPNVTQPNLTPLQRAVYDNVENTQVLSDSLYHLLEALAIIPAVQEAINWEGMHHHDQILIALRELSRLELLEVEVVVASITKLREL